MRNRPLTNLIVALGAAIMVLDGDTVTVDGIRWRLTGYDAPETRFAKCPAERALGLKAAARLGELIVGGTTALTPAGEAKDKYGRRLGRLTVDGRDVGDILIAEDLARPYRGGRRKGWCEQPR